MRVIEVLVLGLVGTGVQGYCAQRREITPSALEYVTSALTESYSHTTNLLERRATRTGLVHTSTPSSNPHGRTDSALPQLDNSPPSVHSQPTSSHTTRTQNTKLAYSHFPSPSMHLSPSIKKHLSPSSEYIHPPHKIIMATQSPRLLRLLPSNHYPPQCGPMVPSKTRYSRLRNVRFFVQRHYSNEISISGERLVCHGSEKWS